MLTKLKLIVLGIAMIPMGLFVAGLGVPGQLGPDEPAVYPMGLFAGPAVALLGMGLTTVCAWSLQRERANSSEDS